MSWLWGRIKVRVDSKEKGGERLGYFTGSFNVLTDRLREEIVNHGGTIITNASVSSITKKQDAIAVEYNDTIEHFDRVIATTPTHIFSKLIANNSKVNERYLEKLNSIDYIGAVVMVFTSSQKISPYYWHNINDSKIPFLVFLSNTVLAGEKTYKGKNVYYIGFYAEHDHRYFTAENHEIIKEWEDGLRAMFPQFDASKIREKQLFKFKNAQHIVDIGYEEKIPPYESVVEHVYVSNFSQIYPEDRGLNFAIREGNKIAELIKKSFSK
jgi:protoporphyrinogen oxidase